MKVIHKLKMDLTKPDLSPTVNAVQGDTCSRSLQISLYTGVHPWLIPENASVAVRYAKSDRTGGYYDTLPDGTSAWEISGNIMTVQMAPQMLTAAGNVKAQIELIQGTHVLSTFCLTVRVEANAAIGILKSENYINWLQWIEDQAQNLVETTHQAANTADLASQSAVQAADKASNSAIQAQDAANAAINAQTRTASIAAKVSATVAGNQAYTKEESDQKYCPAFIIKAAGEAIAITDSTNMKLQELHFFGHTTQNGFPSVESPIHFVSSGDSGNIRATISGKNLCPGYKRGAYLASNGTYLEIDSYYCTELIPVIPGIVYTESNGIRKTVADTHFFSKDREWLGRKAYATDLNKRPDGTAYVAFNYWNTTDLGWIQLEIGSFATQYEPYIEPQVLTLPTPNGLSSIPVTSSGNYTDEAGQNWICDEISFPTGISIQRIGKLDSYNGEPVGEDFLSSTGMLSTGATILYPLAEPVVTSLSEDELAIYTSLHTYFPYTTILNYSGSGMEVSYIADAKRYIDNRINALI